MIAVLLSFQAHAARQEFTLGSAPAWVKPVPVELGANSPADQISAGIYYLLYDNQVRLDGKDRTTYRHFATKAINQKGLENLANIEIRFDPSYQTLTLHTLTIHRASKRIEKLKAESVKILQRERELEYLVYDGSKTANIFLDDVQVGDIVEYAYSVRGNNPVFGGLHAGRFDLQWSAPVHQVHASLTASKSRAISISNRNTQLTPNVTETVGERRREWSVRDVVGLTVESDAPASYDPYPAVEWSEFADWEAVAQWATPLYSTAAANGAVAAVAAKLKADRKTLEQQTVEALRYVQREIRYLSVAVGAGSHAPRTPQTVLERRFGDCKDKALLLITLLRQLGVEAKVALVNTTTQAGVRDTQPSPFAFNHVIVRAQVGERVLWLDPTRRAQGGQIDSLHQFDYGYALVIDGATRALTQMFPSDKSASRSYRNIETVIDSRQGLTAAVTYTVTSTLEGGSAENLRATLGSTSRDEIQKQYLTYYTSYFPDIRSTAKFTVEDNFEINRIVVREFYEVPKFWKASETQKRQEAYIPVPDVDAMLKTPRGGNRSSPLSLAYPMELLHTTDVLLPEAWQLKPKDSRVDGPGIVFERRIEHPSGNRIVIRDRVATTADAIPVAALPEYSANLGKARDLAAYALTAPLSGGNSVFGDINGLIATLAALMLVGWIWLGRFVSRWDPSPRAGAVDPTLVGLRGWLLYVGFVFLLTPIRIGHQIWTTLPSFTVEAWAELTNRASETYHPLWAPLVVFELACNLGLLTFSVVLIILFFKKRSSVPNIYICFVWTSIVFVLGDLLLSQMIPGVAENATAKEWRELMGSAIAAVIWTIYFKRSVRVRSTFVRTFAPTSLTTTEPTVKHDLRDRAFGNRVDSAT